MLNELFIKGVGISLQSLPLPSPPAQASSYRPGPQAETWPNKSFSYEFADFGANVQNNQKKYIDSLLQFNL